MRLQSSTEPIREIGAAQDDQVFHGAVMRRGGLGLPARFPPKVSLGLHLSTRPGLPEAKRLVLTTEPTSPTTIWPWPDKVWVVNYSPSKPALEHSRKRACKYLCGYVACGF